MEDFVGVLRGVRGRTVDTVYDLFFTEKKMTAAILIHPSDFNDIYGKIDLTTLVFGNFPKQREVKMRSVELMESRRSAFEKKTVDEILTMHRLSFEIEYGNIISVRLREGLLSKSLEFVVANPPGKKVNFSLDEKQIAEAKELIAKVLPEKMK